MGKKVLVIVAHPDDETIWMGGLLLKNKKKWDISIISLCRKDDIDRSPKFKKVCEIYNAKSFISDLEDEDLNPLPLSEIKQRIKKFIDSEYDYIFTHGSNGEYGHIRHKEIHRAVKEMIGRDFKCNKLFFFSYVKKGVFCSYNPSADNLIKLDNIKFDMKKKIITEYYGFSKGSFEEKSCSEIESFENEMPGFISISN